MHHYLYLLLGLFLFSCQSPEPQYNILSTDIDNFWLAYEAVQEEEDSLKRIQLVDSLYISKGTEGLSMIMEARNYTAAEYADMMIRYPAFFTSIRPNTQEVKELSQALGEGIQRLENLYSPLRPANIYFTMGCMRTNGTVRDSSILIGSELALMNDKVDISEFDDQTQEWLNGYIATEPLNNLVLLNVHEYVHTQQQEMSTDLLYIVLYEGVAEFLSVLAMEQPSSSPAIEYGKANPAVRDKFEEEMFYNRIYEWLWSNAPNEFNTRDLGYYIGYEIAERYYTNAKDKKVAIHELINLDYSKTEEVDALINSTSFFSREIAELRNEDKMKRPKVADISIVNGSEEVDPSNGELRVQFSEKMNGYNTGLNYSVLGEEFFPNIESHVWSADSMSWTVKMQLEADKHYQFWITENFRTNEDIPLMPYLVDFKTQIQ